VALRRLGSSIYVGFFDPPVAKRACGRVSKPLQLLYKPIGIEYRIRYLIFRVRHVWVPTSALSPGRGPELQRVSLALIAPHAPNLWYACRDRQRRPPVFRNRTESRSAGCLGVIYVSWVHPLYPANLKLSVEQDAVVTAFLKRAESGPALIYLSFSNKGGTMVVPQKRLDLLHEIPR
jgi:hypothetical protein